VSLQTESVVRIGVVGGGLIAQVAHLPALSALDALYEPAALAEPDPGVREVLARRYGIAATYADHEALLAREQLDALLVCSPNATHARIVLDALDAGLHVLVEKPLCLRPGDGDAIVARARERDLVVAVGYMKRYEPAYEALLEHAPAAGELRLASSITVDPGIATRLRPVGFAVPAPLAATPGDDAAAQVADAVGCDDPRHVRAFSDAFLGALVHDVNLVLDVGARLGVDGWRATDAAAAQDGTLAYGAWAADGGARWTALWSLVPAAGTFSEELRLLGVDGALRLRLPAPYYGCAPAELCVDGEPQRRFAPAANAYVRELEHFHACVTRGAPCRTPAVEGARDVAFLADLYRTAIAT
jgi:predicted dehydrogenase